MGMKGSRHFMMAAVVYAALSYGLLAHGAPLRYSILGMSSDPMAFIWCLAWWPHALLHHLNPLHPLLIWQPEGMDLVWMTSVPLLALLMAPVTLWLGPLLSYNLITLAAPVMSGLAAYTLCLFLTRRPLAAFCGGLAYGFCTYAMAESLEHLNLDFTALPPILLLIVLMRLEGRLSRPRAALFFALCLAAQFYVSMEIAFTNLIFGGLAWGLALVLYPAYRARLRRLVADGALAGLFALPLLAPFLWDIVTTKRSIEIPQGWSYMASARFGQLFVTTPASVLYDQRFPVAGQSWLLHLPQCDFTTGLPLLLLVALYVWRRGQQARFLGWTLFCILLLALGPQLWVNGRFTDIVLPWRFLLPLPLVGSALPVRFLLPASLIIAIILALWAGQGGRRRDVAVCLAVAITLMPPHPVTPAPNSTFFRPAEVQAALGSNARVLILPCASFDASSFWQAQAQFSFSQTTGYLGMPPAAMLAFPGVRDLIINHKAPQLGAEIAVLVQATRTQYVLAGPCTEPVLKEQLQMLSWPARRIDDTLVFTIPTVKP
jgi:hypothetical protein